MMKRKTMFRPVKDIVSEEMAASLLTKPSYEFGELFEAVHARLRLRNAVSSGEEMLRLRVYEKLQVLVAQGIVNKAGKTYSAVRAALEGRIAEMAAEQARIRLRKSALRRD
jgi:hypothetical protein